jgi:hypothetical protein
MRTGTAHDIAVNRYTGPASKLPHDGFERPSHCAFGPDGALYVVDFGEIEIAPEVGGIRIQLGAGALWRTRRTDEPGGQEPPQPKQVPLYCSKPPAPRSPPARSSQQPDGSPDASDSTRNAARQLRAAAPNREKTTVHRFTTRPPALGARSGVHRVCVTRRRHRGRAR